ncbi:metalloprotease [Lactarius psammicola]|nr:metalloprotease [Lactarius psammicola]
MASFSKLLSSVLIALLYASTTSATPWPSTSKHATHRTRSVGADGSLKLETFHPESIFEGFGVEGLDHPLARRAGNFDIKAASVSFLASKLGIQPDDIQFRTSAKAEVAQHAFLKQQINGVPVANAVANVAFNDGGKVLSFSSSFVKPSGSADETPTVSLSDAIATAEKALDGTHNGHPATLEFLIRPDGSAALTHVIQIQNESAGTWVEAFVDAHSNEVLSVTDFVTKASYRVVPINEEVPTQGFQTLTNPQDSTASPLGWHDTGTGTTTTTSFTQAPTVSANINAAVTNAFYIVNSVHDYTYRYGFTEATFNFQTNNFGKGGAGNDRVTPDRDGAVENDIVIHENTHGVTNRMTGGGTGRCLQTTEAGGMGEGWSDAMADWNAQGATTVNFVLGQYVINDPAGIRSHPYSTSATTNPLRYSSLKTLTEVHGTPPLSFFRISAVRLIHGQTSERSGPTYSTMYMHRSSLPTGGLRPARTNPGGTEGNIVFMHLFLDALLLQPCNPTFLTARNAWIQADANRYAGANKCLLWHAFASKGLVSGIMGDEGRRAAYCDVMEVRDSATLGRRKRTGEREGNAGTIPKMQLYSIQAY